MYMYMGSNKRVGLGLGVDKLAPSSGPGVVSGVAQKWRKWRADGFQFPNGIGYRSHRCLKNNQ